MARQPTFIHLSRRRWEEDIDRTRSSANQFPDSNVKEKTQVILYTRPGCHLCEEMKKEMARTNCGELYELEEINIESNPELLARYQYDIPLLLINGVEA